MPPELDDLKSSHGLEDLEEFDLLGDLVAFRLTARNELSQAEGPAVVDRTLCLALSAAIARLDEPDVPREIFGQRLAAVITKCAEAADWEEHPETAAVAAACLELRLRRRRPEAP